MPEYKPNGLKLDGVVTLPRAMASKIKDLLIEFDSHLELQHSDDGSPVRYDIHNLVQELNERIN